MITHELKTRTETIKIDHNGTETNLYLEDENGRYYGIELGKNELHDLIGLLLHVQAKIKR